MKVIGVQLDIAWQDKPANYEKVRRLLATVELEPGGLLVLPEMFAVGFSMNVASICQGPARRTEAFLAETARRHQIHVIGGVVNAGTGGRARNEAVVFSPAGEGIARYCKLHPFSFAGEANHYDPGEKVVTFPVGELTATVAICYDLRFPELFRAAVLRGAQLLIVIANWPAAREAHWTTLLGARAVENQAYVVGVNRCGSDPNVPYRGRSLIVDPRGNILADAGCEERTFSAELDPASLNDYRRQFPTLADIRPDLIGSNGRLS